MFPRREDGLGWLFLPFDILALVPAALLTYWCGARGLLAIPVLAGWWILSVALLVVVSYLPVFLLSLTVDTKNPPRENHPVYRAIVVYAIGQLCRFARVRLHVTGLEKLPEGRFLLVSNHRSAYDPICTVWSLRKTPLAVVTKPENMRIAMVGPMIWKSNYLPIDRENPREAMKTIQIAAELLKNDVVSVGIYPEGTRNRAPEAGLLPFHNGVFKIAQKAKAPLVTAAITGTEKIGKNFPWRHTDVYLNICETIPAAELSGSTAAVSERVRTRLEEELARMEKG